MIKIPEAEDIFDGYYFIIKNNLLNRASLNANA